MIFHNMIISYDLRNQRDYTRLFNAIQELGNAFPILDSVWYVKTTNTAVQCKQYLENYLDLDDSLVVFDCSFNDGDVLRCYNEASLRSFWTR